MTIRLPGIFGIIPQSPPYVGKKFRGLAGSVPRHSWRGNPVPRRSCALPVLCLAILGEVIPRLAGPVPRRSCASPFMARDSWRGTLGKVNSIPLLAILLKLRYTYLDDKM